jgi:hypothetical protein
MAVTEDFFENFNTAATQELEAEAASSRQKFLQLTGIVVRELLDSQAFAADFAEQGEELQYTVGRDQVSAISEPTEGKVDLLSVVLKGRNIFQGRDEQLKLQIPVPRDFDQDDPEEIDNLPDPSVVYTERSLAPEIPGEIGRVISRYAVTVDRAYPYEHEETEIFEALTEKDIAVLLDRRVPDDYTRIVRLRLDLVRFRTAAQRQTVVGQADVFDL